MQITVADTISYLMNFYDGKNLSPTFAKKLVDIGIYFQVPPDPKFALHIDFMNYVWNKISKQWSSILSVAMSFG